MTLTTNCRTAPSRRAAWVADNREAVAKLPGVLRIDVRDSAGVALLSVRALSDGSLVARSLPADMPKPPAGLQASAEPVQVGGIDALQVVSSRDQTCAALPEEAF